MATKIGNSSDAFVKWVIYPEDILTVTAFILTYLGRDHNNGQCPLYKSAIARAQKLLGVNMGKNRDREGRKQLIFLSKYWRERLETAGIDPDTVKIVDKKRWAIAWKQLKAEGRYYPSRVEVAYRLGQFEPEAEPEPVVINTAWSKENAAKRLAPEQGSERAKYIGKMFRDGLKL